MTDDLTFRTLLETIGRIHSELIDRAKRAVNVSLTLRNWLIGYYIDEYQLEGSDRAEYGDRLIEALSDELLEKRVSGTGKRQLYQYIAFYRTYPQIVRSVTAQFDGTDSEKLLGQLSKFTHEHIGQLNTYVSWYAENEMTEGDSPPIGLLLCTEKDSTVVKYALAGMSNQLFVSRYQVSLPSPEEIRKALSGEDL